ncbi:T9SS type A sorting domain-containing protein [Flavobacterium sp.]|uniref:T9SS type A sorting domain-containing protein n=1 Tax=Flavobacterium sp. TaxID=239 RepID=UPI00391C3877
MKKLLLLSLILCSSIVSAQIIQSEDFNGLTIGNIGTDPTGVTAGQGEWLTFTSNGADPTTGTNAGNSNFQVVASGFGATNGLKIVSSNGNKGNRFMWKDGLDVAWDTRTEGNEIIEVEYDFFTGPATTSTAQVGVRLYATDNSVTPAVTRTVNGFVYSMNTRVLQGVAYLNNAGTFGTFLINLAAAPGLVLTADTWYRIGFAYDTTTGETIWKASTVYTGLPAANWAGPFPLISEVDFVSTVPTTNSAVSEVIFDNLVVEATFEEELLGVNTVNEVAAFSVFPNPTTNNFTINSANSSTINGVEMVDINGRTVKSIKFDNLTSADVNIADLSQGVYMVKISSENGSVTQKIVKQ